MLRRLARLCLFAAFAASLAATGLTAARIAGNPDLAPLRDATAAEFGARVEQMMVASATPEVIADHIRNRLADEPRNWLALDALADLAVERGIALPPDLLETLRITREDDHGYYAQAASCAACAYDVTQCSLEQVMICQAPIALTPIGDIAGVARAGVAYAGNEPVDQIDLALSVVGLGATVAVLVSGGGSGVVKAGAGLAKMARKMGRLSPRLVEMAVDAARAGVDWAALPGVRSLADLRGALRPGAFAPLTATLGDLDRVRVASDATTALHLLPMVEDAADARRLALAAETLGPKLVGRAEILGKARLMRAAVRFSSAAWATIGAISALLLSIAGLVGHGMQTALLRIMRRLARAPAG